MKISELHEIFLDNPYICTDTRKINSGDIFFALKGDNFNGNKYADEALRKGASYAVIDEKEFMGNQKILVNNVLETLQKLANFHRNNSHARIIALTGSNGKTTTKELIYSVLSQKYKTVATVGNLNNHIGVPLTLLSIKQSTEIAIVEMGANHQKEIAFLCSIAEPDFGYITNFGKAHLEGFGGIEGVIKGKSELYEYLTTHNKGIFMNADDPIQKEKLGSYIKKFGFSTSDSMFFTIHLAEADPFVKLEVDGTKISSNLIGEYNFPNCCAAIIIGKYFNVDMAEIKSGIENYIPSNNRSQLIEKDGHQIILDAYNANPSSMTAALGNFSKMKGHNKILFLGDMFELGTDAPNEHQKIAALAKDLGFEQVHLIGANFSKVDTTFSTYVSFNTFQESWKNIKIPKSSSILIKGSRGMALERIMDLI